MGRAFSPDEDLIILTCRDYGLTYEAIAQKLKLRGYDRDKATIRYRYVGLKRKERQKSEQEDKGI